MSAPQTRSSKGARAQPAEFEDVWSVIKSLLDDTLRRQHLEGREPRFGDVSYTAFMGAYTKAYNLGTNPVPRSVSQVSLAQQKTYSAVSAYFFGIADEMLAALRSGTTGGLPLVDAYLDAYDRYLRAALLLPRLLRMFNDGFLRLAADEWFTTLPAAPGMPDIPFGMKLIDPDPPRITILNGVRHEEALPIQSLIPVPIERADIGEEIMRWDSATAAGAPKAEEVATLLWPSEGKPVPSGDAPTDVRETAQFEARRYASLPANVYMPLVPTILRLMAPRDGQALRT
ncbi:hypothetical protein CALVIDRAFT_596815 [Calocera viscosa TUFC12733]|uniref:Uncharacterized protein n=1 Tax=Calocera viscosa (strain TUFC12733) TaxID=1330018 RepID=A0A167NZR3_CALVF|nr:hypothetical protein CALVIDRAFT_596815 [Calocera viscosa TUFC12733]